jgi:hypothetical protein
MEPVLDGATVVVVKVCRNNNTAGAAEPIKSRRCPRANKAERAKLREPRKLANQQLAVNAEVAAAANEMRHNIKYNISSDDEVSEQMRLYNCPYQSSIKVGDCIHGDQECSRLRRIPLTMYQ